MGKKIFAEISKKYFGVGPVLVQGGPDLVQGGPLLVQGGPLLVQPKVSSTDGYLSFLAGLLSFVVSCRFFYTVFHNSSNFPKLPHDVSEVTSSGVIKV